MPRIRTIKPEFWDDEKLAKLTLSSNLLFIGMWNFADDQGVIFQQPHWIKSRIFPHRENIKLQEVKSWLLELENSYMIITFEFDNSKYYLIRSFSRHQRIDKPQLSKIPAQFIAELKKKIQESSLNNIESFLPVKEEDSNKESKGEEREEFKTTPLPFSKKKKNSIDAKNCSTVIAEIKANTSFLSYLSKNGSINPGQLLIYLDEFFREKNESGYEWKSLYDLEKHISSWLPKYIGIKNKQNPTSNLIIQKGKKLL